MASAEAIPGAAEAPGDPQEQSMAGREAPHVKTTKGSSPMGVSFSQQEPGLRRATPAKAEGLAVEAGDDSAKFCLPRQQDSPKASPNAPDPRVPAAQHADSTAAEDMAAVPAGEAGEPREAAQRQEGVLSTNLLAQEKDDDSGAMDTGRHEAPREPAGTDPVGVREKQPLTPSAKSRAKNSLKCRYCGKLFSHVPAHIQHERAHGYDTTPSPSVRPGGGEEGEGALAPAYGGVVDHGKENLSTAG
eukprot:CAMPEP_0206221788 /NCGR_PEP_ID=MMETSP0047_2-20121206/5609_1 /ASSEMBLY_ACC=CAM_ASM_000192 /TAXON_ID=195065 /ORGANISM="Chroomonas mesostigmatica_cf, Strain CCMP1168" /LENGTH=244 /DNA_ID=CAMNT_0053644561 /DNA_START=66 /DNA_END=797 /DNA_ORIENTATION=-